MWSCAARWAAVGAPKMYAPSPTVAMTVFSGAPSFAPSAAPRPQPSPPEWGEPKQVPGPDRRGVTEIQRVLVDDDRVGAEHLADAPRGPLEADRRALAPPPPPRWPTLPRRARCAAPSRARRAATSRRVDATPDRLGEQRQRHRRLGGERDVAGIRAHRVPGVERIDGELDHGGVVGAAASAPGTRARRSRRRARRRPRRCPGSPGSRRPSRRGTGGPPGSSRTTGLDSSTGKAPASASATRPSTAGSSAPQLGGDDQRVARARRAARPPPRSAPDRGSAGSRPAGAPATRSSARRAAAPAPRGAA